MTILAQPTTDHRLVRVARLLFEQHHQAAGTLTEWTMREWDAGPQHVNRAPWLHRARAVLAAADEGSTITYEYAVEVGYPHWDGRTEFMPGDRSLDLAHSRYRIHQGRGAAVKVLALPVRTGPWEERPGPDT